MKKSKTQTIPESAAESSQPSASTAGPRRSPRVKPSEQSQEKQQEKQVKPKAAKPAKSTTLRVPPIPQELYQPPTVDPKSNNT